MKCFVKENSFIAKCAAWKLGTDNIAIVIGRTIHLHNASKDELIGNHRWLRHEIAHVKQYNQYGFCLFLAKYLWESLQHGYRNNKFEIMARAAERDERICDDIVIQ